ncbi:dolichol-phosphate mannosyltransferase subunit 3 [Boletus edulis BED1]|uniref:Dolichol-phosphate mannosyltransferase subunit 3 n=1 Tax=Boletus edulis BED1 TaxID=1328754 RepID=A0AAD4G641_BOLED|nr:dolichol-phosphate mannosyltransferase subunit 3 [Boletus edulis BED1]
MARAHRLAIYASFSILIYLLVLLSILPIPFFEPDLVAQLLPVIPWWLLVSFGSYSLASLGWGLFTFQDCPDAYHELLQEINDANNDLRGKGVTVD